MFRLRPARLLFVGEYGISTGFGGVSREICDRLYGMKTEWGTPMFELGVMAHNIGVDPLNGPPKDRPYKIFPSYGNREKAPFGQDYAADLVRKFKPDIVIAFGDTWMLNHWNDPNVIPADLRKTFKLVAYVAIDGYPIPRFWIDIYKQFDKVITFTKFGKDCIDERAKMMGVNLDVSYIYHGVNPQIFKPLPQADIDRYKQARGLQGKKIVGMFSRNQPRKHHPEFVEFAAKLLEVSKDENLMFYFHCMESDAGWNLPELIEDYQKLNLRERFLTNKAVFPGEPIPEAKFDLKNKFFFPGIQNPAAGVPPEHLNMLYNMCEAHVQLNSGEGMGCTIQESLCAGVPTFTNDYAASAELVKDSNGGEVIKSREFTYRGSDHNFFRPHTDYEDAVNKVLPVLKDPEVKKKYSRNGRAYSLGYDWNIVCYDWKNMLDNLYKFDLEKPMRTEVI